jgi:FAD/FMN-containing dehydrogenase
MASMEVHAAGIQLADENLGRRSARFMKDENLERLERLRQTYDPARRFRSWMGLPQQAA